MPQTPQTEPLLRMRDLVEQTGVPKSTILYYLQQGLLPEPVKTSHNMAYYDPQCITRIRYIQNLQRRHRLSLSEIRLMVETRGEDADLSIYIELNDIIFGPVKSRRLGSSLGINLLPADSKICSFNCIYCECGWTGKSFTSSFPDRNQVTSALSERLKSMAEKDNLPDSITYAGNGEPSLHPDFDHIIYDSIKIRDKYAPLAKIAVLSKGAP